MPRNWSFDIALFLGICLATLAMSHFFRGVDTLPVIPLKQAHNTVKDGRWEDLYSGDNTESGGAILREIDGGFEIRTHYKLPERGAELVFADKEGKFEGSWCSGRLGFASLVLPQVNNKGRISLSWVIPFYDIRGKLISVEERDLMKSHLIGSGYLSGRSSEPYIAYEPERYACPAVAALLEVESATLEWDAEQFTCFDAGSRFGSHSSHDLRVGDAVMGEAEMFTWHRAPIRLSWDLHGKGELVSEEIRLEEGAAVQRGGTGLKILAVKDGEFRLVPSESKRRPGEAMTYLRTEANPTARTCFLAGNLPGRAFVRVELKAGDGTWKEAAFAAEKNGVITVELTPGSVALRTVWRPGTMRVVVDVPGIGGSLPVNDGVTSYNEIQFPLHGAVFENNGMSWRLWQLLGSYPRITGDLFDAGRAPGTRAEPGKLYRADDLYQTWQRMNPDLKFDYDGKLGAIVIEDR